MLFARRESTTTGLVWGYYGGKILASGAATSIANGSVSLSASTTNYVEATNAGEVSKNTSGFTAAQIPLYTIVTGTASVTSYTDHRLWGCLLNPRAAISMDSDANKTLTQAEARADIIDIALEAACPRTWIDAALGAVFVACLLAIGYGLGG